MDATRDHFTGLTVTWQAGRVSEEYLEGDGRFNIAAFNAVRGEKCDISDPTSMATIYGLTDATFRRHVLPDLEFVKFAGPVPLSCVSSLSAHADNRQVAVMQARREAGCKIGSKNLIRLIGSRE